MPRSIAGMNRLAVLTSGGDALARHFTEHAERLGFEQRATKLGHVQAAVRRARSIA